MGAFAFKHPELFRKNYFELLSQLLTLILEVAQERRPLMQKVAIIYPEEGTDKEIVTVWAGAGIGSNPTDRIRDLVKENELLKRELSKLQIKTPNNEL